MCLADEADGVLCLSLLQGNFAFLEYVLVRFDMDMGFENVPLRILSSCKPSKYPQNILRLQNSNYLGCLILICHRVTFLNHN